MIMQKGSIALVYANLVVRAAAKQKPVAVSRAARHLVRWLEEALARGASGTCRAPHCARADNRAYLCI